MKKDQTEKEPQSFTISEAHLLSIIEDYITHSCIIKSMRNIGFEAADAYEAISFDVVKDLMGYPDGNEAKIDSPEWELDVLVMDIAEKYIGRVIERGGYLDIAITASLARELYYELKFSKEALISRAKVISKTSNKLKS